MISIRLIHFKKFNRNLPTFLNLFKVPLRGSICYRKIDRKITFDFEDPGNPVEGTFSKSSTCFVNSMPKQVFSA